MSELKGSKTEQNLKDAFAGESQANRRYLYFAAKADVEGFNDVSAVFRSTAEGETGHAHGHLEHLEASGDPATGLPIGATDANLKAAIAGETHLVSSAPDANPDTGPIVPKRHETDTRPRAFANRPPKTPNTLVSAPPSAGSRRGAASACTAPTRRRAGVSSGRARG